jgi:hypothetical protein
MKRHAGRKALFCYVCHSCIHDGGLYQVYCRIVLCKRPMVNSGRPLGGHNNDHCPPSIAFHTLFTADFTYFTAFFAL